MSQHEPVIAIVGAGFGGLWAARALRSLAAKVVLIDRHNYHLFQPLLYQVAMAGLSPGDIAKTVREITRGQRNLEFRMAEVRGADLAERRLDLSTGTLNYDYLILSVGSETNFFGLETVAEHAHGLKDITEAVGLRNHILSMFEQAAVEPDPEKRRAQLTFVVVGGGPTGVELSGAISELIRLVLVKDYPQLNFTDARVLLLEASDRVLAALPEPLRAATAETLWRKHVEVRFGAAVAGFDGQRVNLKGGEIIPAHTLIWCAGVRAEHLVDTLGLPQASQKRVRVEPTLQVPGHPEVLVIGDAAYLEENGQPLPMVAQVAMQQARLAAANIRHMLAGESLGSFHYHDLGTMATIGRNAAVALIGRLQFRGFLAWGMWLVVHILQLIGFRNRLLVLINWIWDYLFYERAVRLISDE